MKSTQTWKWLLLTALMLLPSLAFAQIFGGEIPDEDVSVKNFLNPLFGELVGKGGGSDPLVVLIKTFNLGVLTLGGILVFYTLVAGTLSTAHDGEMLGKRWSALWVPIRTTLGAAAIMPSIGGGYAVIQALVMWLALQGVSMANSMWGMYLDNDPVADAFYVPPGATRQIRETFNDMFLSNVCSAALREAQSTLGGRALSANFQVFSTDPTPLSGNMVGYAYGPFGNACGRVALAKGSNPGASQAGIGPGTPASSAALVDSQGMNEALFGVHASHLGKAQAKLRQMADKLVETGLSQEEFDTGMRGLVSAYADQLRTTALAQHEATRESMNAKMVEGMKKDGWAMAGMYYMAIVRSQDEITRAISQTPATSTGQMAGSGHFAIDAATSGLAGAALGWFRNKIVSAADSEQWISRANDLVKGSNAGTLGGVEEVADEATGKSWVMKVVSWFMNDDMGMLGPGATNSKFSQQGQNPIIMVKNLGENMTTMAWTALTIGGGVLALSGAGMGIAGDWATVFTPVLFSLFGLLVVPGATLSSYVPMIPYILWVGVVIGWVILIVEAIIAAPIWAVAHMAPDGDGVVGRGGQGYMLVLSLVLRPPLMILGLVCSISLMKPLGYFVNSTFLGAFAMGVNPGPMALTQLIAGCIIYTVVMISVIHRVFTLIHVIPDKILRWIGGGGNELGEQAQQMEAFSTGKVVAAVGATQQIGTLTQGAAQGMRDLSRKQADAKNAASIRQEESRSRMAQVEANTNDQAHRAGMEAFRSSAAANAAPNDPAARSQAAATNQMARDARLQEAETKLGHAMESQGYKGGLPAFRKQSMEDREMQARQAEQEGNMELASAMGFANEMDNARSMAAQDPEGTHMQRFMARSMAAVQQQGQDAKPWDAAAAKGLEHEIERRKFSQPPPGPGTDPPPDGS